MILELIVPRCLPVAPRPVAGELLSSWIERIAAANAITGAELLKSVTDCLSMERQHALLDYCLAPTLRCALAIAGRVSDLDVQALELGNQFRNLQPEWVLPGAKVVLISVAKPGICTECIAEQHIAGVPMHLRAEWALAVGTSASNFGFSMMQSAQPLTLTTGTNTVFQNISGMGMMSSSALVMVDAMLQSDGSIQAQKVHWFMGSGGVMADGMVGAVTGSPTTQIGMVVQNGSGQGMMPSFLANNATVSLTGSTAYYIDTDGMDISNLPFTPMFDANHMYPGERVRCISNSGMGSGRGGMGGMGGMGGGGMMGNMNASECDLVQQGFTGTVSNYPSSGGQATFTLTLATDSYFAIMTGTTTITVHQQPGTQLLGLTSVANGQTVQVRGLMFDNSGVFNMVASRIMNP